MKFITSQYGLAFSIFIGFISNAYANSLPPDPAFHITYEVSDWREEVPEKAAEYKNYRIIVFSNQTYSDDEKAAKIARKYTQIRSAVRNARTEAYSAVSEIKGVGNSVTKGSSGGGSKNVAAKCIGSSKPHMYTTPQWAQGAYKSGDDRADVNLISNGSAVDPADIVVNKGANVCAIALRQSGRGRKVSYSEATFRIRPEQIKVIVDAEVLSMMYAISDTPL